MFVTCSNSNYKYIHHAHSALKNDNIKVVNIDMCQAFVAEDVSVPGTTADTMPAITFNMTGFNVVWVYPSSKERESEKEERLNLFLRFGFYLFHLFVIYYHQHLLFFFLKLRKAQFIYLH
jgi:hypothetical protein